MIEKEEIQKIICNYPRDISNISICSLGSHSALDISKGAKDEGFKTLVICKKGRERTYKEFYKRRKRGEDWIGCIDETIVLNEWKEMINEPILKKLRENNSIIVPHRSLVVYLGYEILEEKLTLPIFGNRKLLRAEERVGPFKIEKNQDYLLRVAGIPTPKKFNLPEEIDRPVIIKATKAIGERYFQRQFIIVKSYEEYEKECRKLIEKCKTEEEKKLIEKNFKSAPIEEYISGEKVNLNFFYSKIHDELELLGTDTRKQFPNGEEFLHAAVSLRESLLEKAYEMGEKFCEIVKREFPPGIIGPFSLQCVGDENENLVVYDVSLRTPGSPDIEFTPYTEYLFNKPISFGRRIAIEIKEAIISERLEEIIT